MNGYGVKVGLSGQSGANDYNGEAAWSQNGGYTASLDMYQNKERSAAAKQLLLENAKKKTAEGKYSELSSEEKAALADYQEQQAKAAEARKKDGENVLGGLGYVFGTGRDTLLGDLFGVGVDGDSGRLGELAQKAMNLAKGKGWNTDAELAINQEIANIERQLAGDGETIQLAEAGKTTVIGVGRARAEKRLSDLKKVKVGNYLGGSMDSTTSWSDQGESYEGKFKIEKQSIQGYGRSEKEINSWRLVEDTTTGVKSNQILNTDSGEWETLNHGDVIMTDVSGKVSIIPKDKIADYVKANNVKDAIVTVGGINQNGLEAIKMAQGTGKTINRASAKGSANVITAQFQIFNDGSVTSAADGGNNPSHLQGMFDVDKPTVQKTLASIIEAGGFDEGGSIIGHSAGGYNVAAALADYKGTPLKASVYTFGSAHGTSYSGKVANWTDAYNSDLISELGRNGWGLPKLEGGSQNYSAFINNTTYGNITGQFNTGSNPNYIKRGNLWETSINKWESMGDHLFHESYMNGFEKIYKLNPGQKNRTPYYYRMYGSPDYPNQA